MTGGLLRSWAEDIKEHPPLHILGASFLGYKPPPKEQERSQASHPSIALIRAMHPDGFIKG
jgi:hypothetical protein